MIEKEIINVRGFGRMQLHGQISEEVKVFLGIENHIPITIEINDANISQQKNSSYIFTKPYEKLQANEFTKYGLIKILEDANIK